MGSSRDGLIFLHREQEDFLWLWEPNNGINLGVGTRNGILANISLQGLVYDGRGSSTESQKGEVPHACTSSPEGPRSTESCRVHAA